MPPDTSIWTKEKMDTLQTLWVLEFSPGVPLHTTAEIAEKMGHRFTKNMIVGKAHRMGLPARMTGGSPGRRYPAQAR